MLAPDIVATLAGIPDGALAPPNASRLEDPMNDPPESRCYATI